MLKNIPETITKLQSCNFIDNKWNNKNIVYKMIMNLNKHGIIYDFLNLI